MTNNVVQLRKYWVRRTDIVKSVGRRWDGGAGSRHIPESGHLVGTKGIHVLNATATATDATLFVQWLTWKRPRV
jgi:hypothetical protein